MYAIPPGAIFPDYERYGILWMNRRALATAFDMEGAFNDVTSFSLQAGARPARGDRRHRRDTRPHGGLGAYGREDQFSHRFITEELRGLQTMATVFPVIFLAVAAFLLNVVVTRLISLEREQIGTLKAFGYGTGQITAHYLKLVLAIVAIGLVAGIGSACGSPAAWPASTRCSTASPTCTSQLDWRCSRRRSRSRSLAALAGTLLAVRRAARCRPPWRCGPSHRRCIAPRSSSGRASRAPRRADAHDPAPPIARPAKSGLTVLGIAAAVGILMITNFQRDAIGWMVDVQYVLASREDMTVMFTDPTPQRALYSLSALDGVAMPRAFVPCRRGSWSTATAATGPPSRAWSRRRAAARARHGARPVQVPAEGVVLTEYLANEILDIVPGQMLRIEVLEGRRPVLEVPVAGLTRQYLGVNAYMSRDALNRLLREGPAISGARLAVDPARQTALYQRAASHAAGRRRCRAWKLDPPVQRDDGGDHPVLLLHHRAARRLHRLRGRLQLGAHRAVRAGPRARLAAGARLHARRGGLYPARRDRPADPRGHTARLPVRHRAVGLPRRRLRLGPLPRGAGRRAAHLRARGERRARVVRREQLFIWRKVSRLDLVEVLKTRE
jgi:putative ABC transport system permease protein